MSLFELPKLDEKATKKAVEAKFETYRMYKYLDDFEDRETSITSSLKDIVVATSGTSDQTANAAIYNADAKEHRKRTINQVEWAVKKLPSQEKLLIEKRYMASDAEYMSDTKMYNFVFNPPISAKYYDKLRWKAFYKLALFLNIAVELKEGEHDEN